MIIIVIRLSAKFKGNEDGTFLNRLKENDNIVYIIIEGENLTDKTEIEIFR